MHTVSTALDNLKAQYATEIASLTDTRDNLEALWALETWYGAAKAYENGLDRNAISYSSGGRSFSFLTITAAREAMQAAKGELDSWLGKGGGVRYADLSGDTALGQNWAG